MFIPDQQRDIGRNPVTNQVTLTGSADQLAADQTVKNGVIVQALSTNSASVYIGASTVTTSTGFELQPGQATSIAVQNLSKLYAIGTSGDKVCYITSI